MYAYAGILTALLSRKATGTGTVVEISLFDALAEWMGFAAYHTAYGGAPPARSGAHHASIAPYGPFRASDGSLYLGVQNAREWTSFCGEVLKRPDLVADPRFLSNTLRVEHRPALHDIIETAFRTLSMAEVIDRLESAQIAYARMNSVDQFLDHPQLTARDCWREIGSPAGQLRALLPPLRIDGTTPVMGAVPALGQHTQAILEEIGIDSETINRLGRP